MQYKFFVDGEWRHDERKPFVNGDFGIANTIFLATDPTFIPGNVSPEVSSGSNMDVDNQAFFRLVRIGHLLFLEIRLKKSRMCVCFFILQWV